MRKVCGNGPRTVIGSLFQHRRRFNQVDSVVVGDDPGSAQYFSVLVVGCYMLLRRQKFVWNKTVLFGAVCNTVMAFAFVAATKLTTAANAIVLQFTEPVFVILLMWLIFRKKAGAGCGVCLRGSLCRDSLLLLYVAGCRSHGGNLLAILSGLAYALVMMQKKFRGAKTLNRRFWYHAMR